MVIENIKIMRFILMKPKGGRVFFENTLEFTIQVKKKFGKTFFIYQKRVIESRGCLRGWRWSQIPGFTVVVVNGLPVKVFEKIKPS